MNMKAKGLTGAAIVLIVLIIILAIGIIAFFSSYFTGNATSDQNGQGNESPGGETYNVAIDNFTFSPASVTISKGDTVMWTNNQANTPHTIISDSGNELGSGTLQQGQTYSHKFNNAGTYSYHCSIHPNMHGIVIVQ
jgi:plastocyanin